MFTGALFGSPLPNKYASQPLTAEGWGFRERHFSRDRRGTAPRQSLKAVAALLALCDRGRGCRADDRRRDRCLAQPLAFGATSAVGALCRSAVAAARRQGCGGRQVIFFGRRRG